MSFIVGAKRTPFGAFGGKLKSWTATQLQVHASKAALAQAEVDPKLVDSVTIGNVAQTATDAIYLSRHTALYSGVPIETPALTVNRLCGSGFQSVVTAAQEIKLGDASICLTGGTENMSQAPFALRDVRWGTKFGTDLKGEDTLWSALTDSYCKMPMAITAENLAEKYGISRAECDEFAYRSQQNWQNAQKAGRFNSEMAPITLKGRKGEEVFDYDEHARPDVSVEKMGKLPPVFKKDGVVSAGNASGICDGAAALIVAGEAAIKEHNLKPIARVVAYGIAGVDPSIMGIGPVPAIQMALKNAGLTLDQMDIVEINEAFAPQAMSCVRELGIDMDKFNLCGGAIALGHPLGASGARITGHIAHQLKDQGLKYGVGAACIGGGQGIAIILENAA